MVLLFADTLLEQAWARAEAPGRNLAAACASCHGTNGVAVGGMAVLAGRPRDELGRALKAFRDGAKDATIMHHLARGYSDEQIQLIADFFAGQNR